MMKRIALAACTGLLFLGLTGCGEKDADTSRPAPAAAIERQSSDPGKVIEAIAGKLREDRLLEAVQLLVPPASLDELRAQWLARMKDEPLGDLQPAEYAEQMARFTAADAETALYAELEPWLVKYETEMAAQMPMMVGMGQGFLIQSINADPELDEARKKQNVEVVGAIGSWLQGLDLADRELARKGIAVAVKAARQLDLPTIDAVRALDFDQTVGKAGIALGAVKDILALYGLDLNQTLTSVKANVASRDAGRARVVVTAALLGKSLSGEADMVEVDGRWYGKDTIEQLVQELASNRGSDVGPAVEAEIDAR